MPPVQTMRANFVSRRNVNKLSILSLATLVTCLVPHFGVWRAVALQERGKLGLDRLQEAVQPHFVICSARRKLLIVSSFRCTQAVEDARCGDRPSRTRQVVLSSLSVLGSVPPAADRIAWPAIISEHIRKVFSGGVDPVAHDAWFHSLEDRVRDVGPILTLPLAALMRARARLKKGKQVGAFMLSLPK